MGVRYTHWDFAVGARQEQCPRRGVLFAGVPAAFRRVAVLAAGPAQGRDTHAGKLLNPLTPTPHMHAGRHSHAHTHTHTHTNGKHVCGCVS